MDISNSEKAETYKQLKVKLKKSIACSFWFEALMIEYAIMEDRTSSILQYANVCKDAFDSHKSLSNKLRSIITQINKKHPVLSKKVDINLINELVIWKDERNDLVHRACNRLYDEKSAKTLAVNGKELIKKLDNDSRKVRDAYR